MIKPWITPYANERHEGAFAFDGTKVFFPASTGITECREMDVLWQPTPEDATGPVFWREMHTGRQREAMLGPLCQVCGNKIDGEPISWLVPAIEVRVSRVNGRSFTTPTPPTCTTCIPVATAACPNLTANAPTTLAVRHYRPYGVFGDYVGLDGRLRQGDLQFGNPLMPRMMARHLVVEILDYRKVKAR